MVWLNETIAEHVLSSIHLLEELTGKLGTDDLTPHFETQLVTMKHLRLKADD